VSTPIPYAAFKELQLRLFTIISQEILEFQPNLLKFGEALMAMPDNKRMALLNCMLPSPINSLNASNNPPREFLTTLLSAHHEAEANPLDPRCDINWNRMLDLANRHPQVKQVMNSLLVDHWSDFDEFAMSFDKERCARRMSHCQGLEYQTSEMTHVLCPESQRWMHQSVFYRQFYVTAIAFGHDAKHLSEYGGSLPGLMSEIGQWLTSQEDPANVQIHHFDYLMARGEYEDGRIKWSFKGTGNPAFEQLGLISSSRFYEVAEAMAKDFGLNNNRRAFLDSDLSL
jgi:hypothetical protein